MQASLFGFLSVGVLAAAVHYVVAVCAHSLGLLPANANWAGFICAFPVSYIGHRLWSFRGTQASHGQAFPKFLLVALLGFFGNQCLLWLGLHYSHAPFWLILGLVMGVVAVTTYVLSKCWAFRHG